MSRPGYGEPRDPRDDPAEPASPRTLALLHFGMAHVCIASAVSIAPKAEPTPGWLQCQMLKAAAHSGDEGTIRLAAQLAGCLPCPTCDFIQSACRCAPKGEGEAKPFGLFMLHEDDGQWGAYQVSNSYASDPKAFRLYAAAPVAQAAAGAIWRVGEFVSSARRPEHVLMLAVGDKQIAEYGAHRDFVRWVHSHPPRPSADADRASGGAK